MTKFAVTFPGQGSQKVGMLSELYAEYEIVRETFDEASVVLGYDLWDLVANGPEESLNQTHQTQPALLTSSVAIWRTWLEVGGKTPDIMAGHSLGEYSALVCAGVLSLEDAVKLVEKRGHYMQEAVPEGVGSMAAFIGLADDLIQKACDESAQGEVVSPVNFNSLGQVVIAGNKEAVARAGVACKSAGAKKVMPLAVSVPSHCALMAPAAEKLAADLELITFNTPTVPVINNVDVACVDDVAAIKAALVRQLSCPVQWTRTIQTMASQGIEQVYE
ncbi:MAG: ACP S-malonyltransferase, partial [Psychrosphaera sp.]|nr:ACP S-malonyltransferase [Psychrosphaera sp.]